jgi:hypothetical protein
MFLRKTKGPDEVSGLDVQKSYDARIHRFLKKVEGRSFTIFQRRDDPLNDLFAWGDEVFKEKQQVEAEFSKTKSKLEGELLHARKRLESADRHIEKLNREHQATDHQLQKVSHDNETMANKHTDEIARTMESHSRQMTDEKRKHDSQLLAQQVKYDRDIGQERQNQASQKQQYDLRIETLLATHETQVKKLVGGHRVESTKLVRQLLVNQKDDQAWTDDVLKLKFMKMRLLIETVTAPRNKEFLVPPNQELGNHLDPSNFIRHEGRSKSHFLLKTIIWAIIKDQFFSAPFGFGTFGSHGSQTLLMEVYYAWRELFEETIGTGMSHLLQIAVITDACSGPESYDINNFSIFCKDQFANNWRSATFQCIGSWLALNSNTQQSNVPIVKRSAKNIEETETRIKKVLSEVAGLSNRSVSVEVDQDIRRIVLLGSEIGLQFGIHPAQLVLLSPQRGDQVQIGEDCHDCEDGDAYRGTVYGVQLVTAPGLRKIGDGRSDMTCSSTIVPCEIYPDQPVT